MYKIIRDSSNFCHILQDNLVFFSMWKRGFWVLQKHINHEFFLYQFFVYPYFILIMLMFHVKEF